MMTLFLVALFIGSVIALAGACVVADARDEVFSGHRRAGLRLIMVGGTMASAAICLLLAGLA